MIWRNLRKRVEAEFRQLTTRHERVPAQRWPGWRPGMIRRLFETLGHLDMSDRPRQRRNGDHHAQGARRWKRPAGAAEKAHGSGWACSAGGLGRRGAPGRGIALGLWIDGKWPGAVSWTLACCLPAPVLGALNAWYWVQREGRDD